MRHINSIPIGLTARLSKKKQAIVKTTLRPIDDQNPNRANRNGKTKNIGSVGMTYQKVNDACSAIFASGACSMYIQTIESSVIRGSAANRPPSFPLRFATSEITTTTPADIKYLVNSHCI